MIEYQVILKRHPGSARPDVCLCSCDERIEAIRAMQKYDKQHGFTLQDRDGRYTIATILLREKEPIVGAPVLKETPYHEIFDHLGRMREVK